ncbi:hypothetical protein [Bacteroides sp.]|uniref:hypothetical protein n=1 Tax=Bacteroides sp. TaxID=29523 RepID=UPI002602286A|nr:hypothetical protein [Bacteroides sp.]MDD3040266.1 hypothetical protein [Bacteroides sp.]
MEIQKPKIAMYAKRPFGDKLNAAFDFIKENWKPLLKFTTYLILPLCLIQALSLNGLMGGTLTMNTLANGNVENLDWMALAGFMTYYGLYNMVGTAILSSLVYGLIRTYNEREDRLQGITLRELKPLLLRNIKRMFILIVVSVILVTLALIPVGILVALSLFTSVLIIPLLIAFSVPLALLVPIYLFEDIKIMDALRKTFRLGFATWGGVFLISLVMGIIASVLQGVTMVPWFIATLVKYFFAMSDTGSTATVSIGYSFLLYILAIVETFGAYLSMIFTLVGLAYQYGHASEVVDSITVESDIDNFDKL